MSGICRLCGGRIVYNPKRFAWTHLTTGIDHAPVPAR